jgi:hypothetical protein
MESTSSSFSFSSPQPPPPQLKRKRLKNAKKKNWTIKELGAWIGRFFGGGEVRAECNTRSTKGGKRIIMVPVVIRGPFINFCITITK